jgi:hypothetical protein
MSQHTREVAATRFDTRCNRELGFWNLEFGEKSGERAEFTVCWRVELSSRCRIPCSWIARYGGMRRN